MATTCTAPLAPAAQYPEASDCGLRSDWMQATEGYCNGHAWRLRNLHGPQQGPTCPSRSYGGRERVPAIMRADMATRVHRATMRALAANGHPLWGIRLAALHNTAAALWKPNPQLGTEGAA